jgi:hypothetical protein
VVVGDAEAGRPFGPARAATADDADFVDGHAVFSFSEQLSKYRQVRLWYHAEVCRVL